MHGSTKRIGGNEILNIGDGFDFSRCTCIRACGLWRISSAMTFGPSIECGRVWWLRGLIDRSLLTIDPSTLDRRWMGLDRFQCIYILYISNSSRLCVSFISEIRFIRGDVSFSTFIKMDCNLVSNTSIYICILEYFTRRNWILFKNVFEYFTRVQGYRIII